ncbi:MAG TPA: WYL domain-containing protein [Acidimicrobiales bacterium]|nr:WYL domain-containing protein [Acidimicrobiales bacterium]
MRRTDRLYALVEELRARAPRPISRVDLADRLEVTPRTVERDILALQQAGVPIWSQRGRGGGYALDEAWSLPPLNFDATEALAVIAALATARAMPFAEAGQRAQRKLLAAMAAGEAAKAKEVAARVRLGRFGTPGAQRIVSEIERAVVDRRVLELEYRDRAGASTARVVEAHGLHISSTGTYLIGWCRMRDAGRAFRLDRVVAARPTEEIAPERDVDALLDWVDDAVAPHGISLPGEDAGTRGEMVTTRPRSSWGPPRRAHDRTGADAAFARAVAGALPGVDARHGRGRSVFSAGSARFAIVQDVDETIMVAPGSDGERVLLLPSVGRDEVRTAIEDAWVAVAPKRSVTMHRRRRDTEAALAAATQDDVRRFILSLPGATEGPIWGRDLGFLIGTEKRTRFARFGPPEGGRVGNLLPPDDENTLVLLRCPQKPALLAARPDRYFTSPHYGPPDEPGGVIVRLDEHRGAAALSELAEVIEDAWRDVAPPQLQARLDTERRAPRLGSHP